MGRCSTALKFDRFGQQTWQASCNLKPSRLPSKNTWIWTYKSFFNFAQIANKLIFHKNRKLEVDPSINPNQPITMAIRRTRKQGKGNAHVEAEAQDDSRGECDSQWSDDGHEIPSSEDSDWTKHNTSCSKNNTPDTTKFTLTYFSIFYLQIWLLFVGLAGFTHCHVCCVWFCHFKKAKKMKHSFVTQKVRNILLSLKKCETFFCHSKSANHSFVTQKVRNILLSLTNCEK